MSQTFDTTKPISGTTKFSELYQIIRDHDQANQSSFSGSTAPGTPVAGQHWYDTTNEKLYCYTAGSGWAEVAISSKGIGQEIVTARGSHSSLDSRLDAQLNEDGTLKASTSLNPSQWYDLTVASGYVSTTSFRAFGADYTTVYYATRRLKVNRAAGTYYTEVVSSTYSAPNTTVVTRDAVVDTDLTYVSHSIVSPRIASAGDGAVSYEMIGARNVVFPTTTYTVKKGDSVVLASGTFTVTGIAIGDYGIGRVLVIKNHYTPTADGVITYANAGGNTISGSSANVTLYPGQTLTLLAASSGTWVRLDQPNQIAVGIWYELTALGGSFGSNCTNHSTYPLRLMKDPLGFVHLRGAVTVTTFATKLFTLPSGYIPEINSMFPGVKDPWGLPSFAPMDTSASTGNLYPSIADANNSDFSFDGITFKAA